MVRCAAYNITAQSDRRPVALRVEMKCSLFAKPAPGPIRHFCPELYDRSEDGPTRPTRTRAHECEPWSGIWLSAWPRVPRSASVCVWGGGRGRRVRQKDQEEYIHRALHIHTERPESEYPPPQGKRERERERDGMCRVLDPHSIGTLAACGRCKNCTLVVWGVGWAVEDSIIIKLI